VVKVLTVLKVISKVQKIIIIATLMIGTMAMVARVHINKHLISFQKIFDRKVEMH